MTYKVHLDGYNLMPGAEGRSEWPREEFLYWTDDGNVAALRYNDWKITFLRQDAEGIDVWTEALHASACADAGNLRMDPFERANDEAIGYPRWWVDHMFVLRRQAPMSGMAAELREFPPRQKPGSFNLDRVMEAITKGAGDK
jgi:arylsulfatase A-like enzyme